MVEDLGSWEKFYGVDGLVWYFLEVDVLIRLGWFYYLDQDDKVKSVEKLLDIYYSFVGKNFFLLFNIFLDIWGLIYENDVNILKEWRQVIEVIFKINLVVNVWIKGVKKMG